MHHRLSSTCNLILNFDVGPLFEFDTPALIGLCCAALRGGGVGCSVWGVLASSNWFVLCRREGVVVLAAAWHPADTPCLVYYCLVTVPDRNPLTGDEISVEVTKHNPAFQVPMPFKALCCNLFLLYRHWQCFRNI